MEYNNGRVYNVTSESRDGLTRSAIYFQYAHGDEYFTLALHERIQLPSEDGGFDDHMEEADAVSVTTKDGLLSKTVNTGMYANWSEASGEEKQWLRFSGTYAAEYDGDGLLSAASAEHRIGPSGIEFKCEMTKENGLVTEAVKLEPDYGTGGFSPASRFVFEYTDIEIPAGRYAAMINSFVTGSHNNYYYYFWY